MFPLERVLNRVDDAKALLDAHEADEVTERDVLPVILADAVSLRDAKGLRDRVKEALCVAAVTVRVLTSTPVFEISAD